MAGVSVRIGAGVVGARAVRARRASHVGLSTRDRVRERRIQGDHRGHPPGGPRSSAVWAAPRVWGPRPRFPGDARLALRPSPRTRSSLSSCRTSRAPRCWTASVCPTSSRPSRPYPRSPRRRSRISPWARWPSSARACSSTTPDSGGDLETQTGGGGGPGAAGRFGGGGGGDDFNDKWYFEDPDSEANNFLSAAASRASGGSSCARPSRRTASSSVRHPTWAPSGA